MNMAEIEAYVCQSQMIENIGFTKSKQLTGDHIAATEYVLRQTAAGQWPDVLVVHRMLSASFLFCAGSFRTEPVYVASRRNDMNRVYMPSPQYVTELMQWWNKECQKTIQNAWFDRDIESACFGLYYIFLCIHPFEDGNGRVGRLMCNAARRLCGLPWYTFTVDIHPAFVARLRAFETEDFRPTFADAYEVSP